MIMARIHHHFFYADSIIDVLVKQGVEDLGDIPHKPFFEAFCKDYAASLDSMTPIACANVTLSVMDQALLVRMLPFAQNLLAEVDLLVDAVSCDEGQHYDAALQTNLRGYCEMLAFLISYVNAHRPPNTSSLPPSPIDRMPREIITEFLLHALDHYAPKGPMGVSLDTSTSTWKYTQICRIWREVAVSLPQLWSHLRFDYATKSPMSMRNPRALMTILLERSENRPLSIIYDDKHVAMSSPAMTLILKDSWRWQHVHFIIRSTDSLDRLGVVEGLLGNLESVHLCTSIARDPFRHWQYRQDVIGEGLAISTFNVALKLRSVILALSDLDTCRDVYISLPWKQLTRFEEINVALASDPITTNLPNSKLPS